MDILFAPFARKLRQTDTPNPKDYPWPKELVALLENAGHTVTQLGVLGEGKVTSAFIQNATFKQVGTLLRERDLFIAVDSYLQHHAWLVDKKGIVLWGQSDPVIFGHCLHVNLLKDRKYLRTNPFDMWEEWAVKCLPESFVSPEEVVAAVNANFTPL